MKRNMFIVAIRKCDPDPITRSVNQLVMMVMQRTNQLLMTAALRNIGPLHL